MTLFPARVELSDANAFVEVVHRHHKPVVGHRFSVAAKDRSGVLRGVAIVGRPVSRRYNQRTVAEVTRLATDGTHNACSFLYALAGRIADLMGFAVIQTYLLESEPGTSLIAAGWIKVGESRGGDWNQPSRGGRRVDQPMGKKARWEKRLSGWRSIEDLA